MVNNIIILIFLIFLIILIFQNNNKIVEEFKEFNKFYNKQNRSFYQTKKNITDHLNFRYRHLLRYVGYQ